MDQCMLTALKTAIVNEDDASVKKICEFWTFPFSDSFPTTRISKENDKIYLENRLEYKEMWSSSISNQKESLITKLHEMNVPWPCFEDLIDMVDDDYEDFGVLMMLRFLKKNQLIDNFSSLCGRFTFGSRTFLECVSKNGNVAAVTYLLNFCSVSQEDINNSFVVACRNGREDIAFLLAEYVDNVDVKDTHHHSTALMHAAQKAHKRLVGWLLERGADPSIRNESSLDKAKDYSSNRDIRQLLDQKEKMEIAKEKNTAPENKNDSEILPSFDTTPKATIGGTQEEKTEEDEMPDVPINEDHDMPELETVKCQCGINPCKEQIRRVKEIEPVVPTKIDEAKFDKKVMELLEKLLKEEQNEIFARLKNNYVPK